MTSFFQNIGFVNSSKSFRLSLWNTNKNKFVFSKKVTFQTKFTELRLKYKLS